MADDFTVDTSNFSRLSADLSHVPALSGRYLVSAMETTGRNIRDTARENASGMAHAPQFPASITYDFVGDAYGAGALGAFIGGRGAYDIELEVGPDKERPQGPLGNLFEYGSINNAPMGIMHGALQAHEPDLEHGLSRAIDDSLRAAGLL